MVPGFLQTYRLAFKRNSSILVLSAQRILFLMFLESFRCLLANSKRAVMASVWPLYHKCLIGGVHQRWLSFLKVLPSPQRNSGLCQSDHPVLGHLPDQDPYPLIAQFGQAASSKKSPGGTKLLPFKNDVGHCVLRELFFSLPQICTSTQSCLGCLRTIPSNSWLGLCSDMHCQLWHLIYTGVCFSKSY